MFASLKNKIREETGSDISKLTSKITNSNILRQDTNRERHSHQGSTSSINSLISTDGIREDTSSNEFKVEEDFKKQLSKVETDFSKKLEEKENEWQEKFLKQEKHVKQLENEKENIFKINCELREQLSVAEGYKQKFMDYQEDKEQLENFQTQEIAKVKHLVLLREQELAERTVALKDCTQQLEKLKTEVNRLRRQEQLLSDVQEKCNGESTELQAKLAQSIILVEKLQEEQKKLCSDKELECETNKKLQNQIMKLEKDLNDERLQNLDMQKELHRESSERNVALLRNAEISQQMEIVKQESRHKENELSELLNKVSYLESTLKEMKNLEIKVNTENDLRSYIADLEQQLAEKNKNIKSLQMRVTDMKKALQQELRTPGQNLDSIELNNPVAVISPSQSTTKHLHTSHSHRDEEDINFKYLKHVIIKFLTSREYEAQHLTRAVATLLKFSPDEEKLLHDTLEWKMSWFGTRPNLGIGQTAKAIPPS